MYNLKRLWHINLKFAISVSYLEEINFISNLYVKIHFVFMFNV